MNASQSNYYKLFFYTRNWLNIATKLIILVLLFLVLNPSACKKEDVGKCTISIVGGDQEVYDDISIEECQNIFGNTVGANGWKWEPKN